MPSHGSLSKAGKVRGKTPKQWDLGKRGGKIYKHYRKHKVPRVSNKRKFEKRFGRREGKLAYKVPRKVSVWSSPLVGQRPF